MNYTEDIVALAGTVFACALLIGAIFFISQPMGSSNAELLADLSKTQAELKDTQVALAAARQDHANAELAVKGYAAQLREISAALGQARIDGAKWRAKWAACEGAVTPGFEPKRAYR